MDSLKSVAAAVSRARKKDKPAADNHSKGNSQRGRTLDIQGRTVVQEKQLGEGGFAFVWLVRDMVTNEELALKKILCQDKRATKMAMREIEILERLPSHRNLVRFHGCDDGSTETGAKEFSLLFELCPGGHLLDLLDRHDGKLSEEQVLSVFTEIVTAVSVLHDMSPPVQHRDLKVENVLIGTDGAFKLCDFGSWSDVRSEPANMDKAARSELEEQIERYTTMMYRPPEMVNFYHDFVISEKVDLWMLGCMLYTLMFYRHPFQDESSLAIANARYNFPSEEDIRFSRKLQELTHWLLAQNPEDRPSSKALLEILRDFKTGGDLKLPESVIKKMELMRQTLPSRRSTAGAGAGTRNRTAPSGSPQPKNKTKARKSLGKWWETAGEPQDVGNFVPADMGAFPAAPSATPAAPSQGWASFDESVSPFSQAADGSAASDGGAVWGALISPSSSFQDPTAPAHPWAAVGGGGGGFPAGDSSSSQAGVSRGGGQNKSPWDSVLDATADRNSAPGTPPLSPSRSPNRSRWQSVWPPEATDGTANSDVWGALTTPTSSPQDGSAPAHPWAGMGQGSPPGNSSPSRGGSPSETAGRAPNKSPWDSVLTNGKTDSASHAGAQVAISSSNLAPCSPGKGTQKSPWDDVLADGKSDPLSPSGNN